MLISFCTNLETCTSMMSNSRSNLRRREHSKLLHFLPLSFSLFHFLSLKKKKFSPMQTPPSTSYRVVFPSSRASPLVSQEGDGRVVTQSLQERSAPGMDSSQDNTRQSLTYRMVTTDLPMAARREVIGAPAQRRPRRTPAASGERHATAPFPWHSSSRPWLLEDVTELLYPFLQRRWGVLFRGAPAFDFGDTPPDPVSVGVPPSTLERMTTVRTVDGDEVDVPPCVICQDGMEGGQRVRVLPCDHTFHTECIDRWLSEHQTCPMCKREVTEAP